MSPRIALLFDESSSRYRNRDIASHTCGGGYCTTITYVCSHNATISDVSGARKRPFIRMIAPTIQDVLTLTLPDGSERQVPYGTSPSDVVKSIGERLLAAAIAVEVNGSIQDLMTPLRESGTFRVLTAKDARALDVLRHSAAHVLATAVRRLRPDAKIGFGPSIDDGFYYDFEVASPFTPEDLTAFENEMRRVAGERYPFVRAEVDRAEAQ